MASLRTLGTGYLTAAMLSCLSIVMVNPARLPPSAKGFAAASRTLFAKIDGEVVQPLLASLQQPAPAKKVAAISTPKVIVPAPLPAKTVEKPAPVMLAAPPVAAPPVTAPPVAAAPIPEIPPAPPAIVPPSDPARVAQVLDHLGLNLTQDMRQHFDLFLYISKADKGPLSQRLYVVNKKPDGSLALLYDWAASTGREQIEFNKAGQKLPSFTPEGYYELDPDRMYKRYRSSQWDQSMPYAMFFSWINDGLQTGLAIHAAVDGDIAELGNRASAGCIRIAPENAATLYKLIHADYRGQAPVLAYDRKTQTMSNRGVLARDAKGNIKFADGYKVLVFVENYGGGNDMVAALF